MLVEPDVDLASEWTDALEAAGHDVVTAIGTRDAIAHVREGGIDLIVVDPVDGRATMEELMESLERIPDAPPVVMVSGRADGPELSARIGVAGFLTKPCDHGELVSEVGRITGQQTRSSQSGLEVPVMMFEEEPTGPVAVPRFTDPLA